MGQILLVRHGQASWGADDYDQLSDTGWEQSRLLGESLRARGFWPDRIVSGGMRRHLDTCAASGFGEPEIDRDWDEYDHVALLAKVPQPDGELTRESFQAWFERAAARWTDGEHDDYAESFAAFGERVGRAVDSAGGSGKVLVFTSGGPIAWAAASTLVPTQTFERVPLWNRLNRVCANTGVTKLVSGRSGRTLVTFNEHTHLDVVPDLITYR